ncbi:MAG TPA: protein kinase [Gemmatimonadales bacterium]|nr:protein kinase [Gemmatimonadales bacterium]
MTAAFPTVGTILPGPPGVGELRLTGILGHGAYGIVFEATGQDQSSYAVKFLHAGLLATPVEQQALYNEVMAGAQVTHKHVLRVLHFGQEPGLPPYVVTEFANNGTLLRRIEQARDAKSPFPLDIVRGWCLDIASAMEAINARVLHRDLKPDNILFAEDVLKITDFGLAKLVGAATRTLTFKGGQHVHYMAPEAWEGKRNQIQIDMYAAGIVFFEIATLDYPYRLPASYDLDQFRRMHLLETARDPRSIRHDLPQRFGEVLMRLMEKRPENRYDSWAAISAALDAAFDTGAMRTSATVSPLLEHAAKRHREATERRLRDEAERRKAAEEAEIDKKQEQEIIERIRVLIDRFNQSTEGPKASLTQEPGSWLIRFPYARQAGLTFFPAHPALDIPPFEVRHVAWLADADGCGFNLLLRRRPGDLYGQWVVCRVRTNAGALPVNLLRPKCQYFGLGPSEVEHIERGIRAMHILLPEVATDVDASLDAFFGSLYEEQR